MPRTKTKVKTPQRSKRVPTELVLITGMSGSGKASVLKAFEDLGYYCVDNLPIDLIPGFAELAQTGEIRRTALVVDVREGQHLEKLPEILKTLRKRIKVTVLFLEASDEALVRRFSETRRPHPLGKSAPVGSSIATERRRLKAIRALANEVLDTSRFNVHELRAYIQSKFEEEKSEKSILVSCVSFGYKHGVPPDADLVFDVRFLPNPHFIPKFRPLTGQDANVAKYIRSFPQTRKFITKAMDLLTFLLPHYVKEGKSYLTVAFGCTGGQHRSVFLAEDIQKRLSAAGYNVKVLHRNAPR